MWWEEPTLNSFKSCRRLSHSLPLLGTLIMSQKREGPCHWAVTSHGDLRALSLPQFKATVQGLELSI